MGTVINNNVELNKIKRNGITVIKRKDNNFNSLIKNEKKVKLKQVMESISSDDFIQYIIEHYKYVQ